MPASMRKPYNLDDSISKPLLTVQKGAEDSKIEGLPVQALKHSQTELLGNFRNGGRSKWNFGLVVLGSMLVLFLFTRQSQFRSHTLVYPDLLDASLEELIFGLESGTFTSVDLTKAYIARVEESNPLLHAVTELNPEALSIASVLDDERAKGHTRSPLHGIPMLIKNNIATKDKTNTTAGSHFLLGATMSHDATVVSKLRAAGVILLGKSNMSQWANYRSTNSSNGWSALGGQVIAAYHKDLDPSGSSSGSAVGTSVGLAWASLGSETDGSIIGPASCNNIVGLKPTVGLTSRYLVVPISEHQDTIGPMTRTVSEAAHILSIISGKDKNDNYTSKQPWDSPPNYIQALNISSLKGARIGVPRNVLDGESPSQEVLDAFEAAIRVIKDAGAVVVENANFSAWSEFHIDYNDPLGNRNIVLQADFVTNIQDYFSKLSSNPHELESLSQLLQLTQNSPLEAYPQRNTGTWEEALSLGFDNTHPKFWEAYQSSLYFGREGGILGALERYDLDALILPSDISSSPAAGAGLPLISVPMGFYPSNTPVLKTEHWNLVETGPGVPFGLSFLGGYFSEEKLIGLAFAFEQLTQFRRKMKPIVLPKTQLKDVMNV